MKRKDSIVEFIKSYTASNGYPPTVREVGQGVGLKSTSTVMGHLQRLREQGKVSWQDASPRTLRVIEQGPIGGLVTYDNKP